MGTRSQHRTHEYLLPLVGMVAAAALVVGAGWLILSWFLSLGTYIRGAA